MQCPRCGSTQWVPDPQDPECVWCWFCGEVRVSMPLNIRLSHQEPGHSGKGLKRKDLEGVEA